MQDDKIDQPCSTVISKKPLIMDLPYRTLLLPLQKVRASATVKQFSALLMQVQQDISLEILYPAVRPNVPIFGKKN